MLKQPNTENIQKLVAALRSGEYEQGRGKLFDGQCYCVEGVMCDIYRKETGIGEWIDSNSKGYKLFHGDEFSIDIWAPNQVLDYYNLNESIIGMNDNGSTFPEIADYLEENYLKETNALSN